ncbi:DNA-binding response OmpR family regulator [Paenibacillus cellulosilyticus]|uniref:DNA-binding response OmpR family regulator n=1 Tax=Paenibacillus cellulosilyticus TaxID=375489 RepID=A0A2V2YTT5_9BACL|nr:response regulator transcription factor [Paenibacillus cellulosilyticus]PWW03152.1 DNA-binding response OmpR family regulator [Paenibacillus cellulosilyticus]QKS43650.1 response regulator transcription factor [Paenibacillus cellulosilyticus]
MRRILYIEDDLDIGGIVQNHLTGRGFAVDWLRSGDGATQRVADADLVILDVMLPGLDGFTVGQRLKRVAPDKPILMLSARSTIDDKLEGLQFADDYMTKPFHPEELTARIEVLLRRNGKADNQGQLKLGHLAIDLSKPMFIDERSGDEIILTGKQLHIFLYLLRHPNQILTKEQIYEAVWGEPSWDGDKTLNVHIRYLREKIEINPSVPAIIETIRGIGFRVKQ